MSTISIDLLDQLNNLARYTKKLSANTKDIFTGQVRVLEVLLQQNGLNQKELADQLQIKKATVGEFIKKLEKSEYIERRADKNDRRATHIFLTEAGRKFAQSNQSTRNQYSEWLMGDLSSAEQVSLAKLLGKLVNNFEALEQSGTETNLLQKLIETHATHEFQEHIVEGDEEFRYESK